MGIERAQWHVNAARYTEGISDKDRLEHLFEALEQLMETVQRLDRQVRDQQ